MILPLFVVDARQVTVNDGVVGAQVQSPKISRDGSVENPGLFQHVAEVDVGVQEVWIQSHGFFEVMDGQPDLSLGVEHATQVAPCHGEVWPCFNRFQVTSL